MTISEWQDLKPRIFRDFPDSVWCQSARLRREKGEMFGMPEDPEFDAAGKVVRFPWEIEGIEATRDGIIREIFGLCACGQPEFVMRTFYYPYLQNIDKKRSGVFGNNFAEAVNYLVLYVLHDKGLTDHGTSIDGSWLTDKGKTALMLCDAILGENNV